MNAKKMRDWFTGPSPISDMDAEDKQTILRALSLRAAAEANDGTTPETDAARLTINQRRMIAEGRGVVSEMVEASVARLLERERNGLARSYADSLEENARLRAERDTHVAVTERIKVALRIRGTGSYVEWAAHCRDALDKLERAEAELTKLKDEQARAAKIFADALMQWSVEKTELQAELAKLLKSVQEFWEEKP